MMEGDPRRKGPRSPSAESDDSSHRRRSRKYDRDRSPSPRRSRYRRSRSRERRSGSRERRRNKDATVVRGAQDWNKQAAQNQGNPTTTGANYVPPIHNQYQQPPPPPPNTSQPPPTLLPNYNQGYNNYNYNYNQGYDYAYQQQQQPAGYRSDYPPQNWLGNSQVSYNSQQPPPAVMPAAEVAARASAVEPTPPVVPPPASRSDDVKKEAIAAEAKQQKATLTKQRDEYVKKSTTLQRELEILREQCDEIAKESGRENSRIVKENQKLQVEIQTKMKSIHNVIDMLTGIIGDKATVDDLKVKFKNDLPKKRSRSPKDEVKKQSDIKTPEKLTQVIINNDKDDKIEREMKKQKLTDDDAKPIYNFVHYDPEMHWCKICDIFPKTAKEYLNHLHSNEHKETCLEKKIVDMPWHPRNGGGTEKEVPFYPGLPTKRTPIKGLQFFSAATAWYCKLCDSWIGDLHCASLHLKSKRHSTNFLRFVDQNPHWETDWMADREKAFSDERQKQMQLELQKQKDDEAQQQQQHHHQQQKDDPPVGQSSTSTSSKPKKSKKSKKNKKKSKKRKNKNDNSDSTSGTENTDTDSDQDMSKSIRVAMRNKMKASTQAILNEEIDYHGIKLKGHWNQKSDEPKKENDDRHMINSLRDKIKSRNDNNDENNLKSHDRRNDNQPTDENDKKYQNNTDQGLEAWGPKEPPKTFWIKKDDDKTINKNQDIPKSDEIPKPHMGFWTKQQVNISSKMQDNNKNEERERYKDDRKYDRRDDNKYHRYDNYDRRRRDRDRDRDYYDERRKDRRNDDSPPSSSRRERNYRDNSSPKRSYDKYKDSRRDDESNDESKFEKKTNESASKQKKISIHNKKSSTGSSSTTTIASTTTTTTPSTPTTGSNKSGKLPFIGRLPLFKKKNDDIKTMEKDITPLPYVQSKFEDTPKVPSEIINPPGIVHITKLATPVTLNNSITPSSTTTTTPTSIATTKTQHPVMKILVAPPPPIINSPIKQQQPALSPQQVVDMEIENETEDTIIEESIINNNDDDNNSKKTSDIISSSVYDKINSQNNDTFTPTPFIHPPPFVQNPVHYPVSLTTPTIPPPPPTTAFNHPPPSVNYLPQQIDGDLIETGKTNPSDPSQPLPEDLQEALNIIFPKDNETSEEDKIVDNSTIGKQDNNGDNDVMYASMYSGMLGCVGYGPEYMDQPPPEITDDADGDNDEQPETDDLRMLGIDEGDTIL